MPSVARDELGADPDRTVIRILEMRAYAATKRQLDDPNTAAKDRPTGAIADLVREIEVDLWRERRKRKAQRG